MLFQQTKTYKEQEINKYFQQKMLPLNWRKIVKMGAIHMKLSSKDLRNKNPDRQYGSRRILEQFLEKHA